MRKSVWAAFVVLVVLIALPASAIGAIRIRKIAFNPPGSDSGTNTHLNKEWLLIRNIGDQDVQMRGWKIFDRGRDHVYRFGSLLLAPDDRVKLHTGRGNDGAPACEVGQPCPDHALYDFYWGLDNYVWNNDGDRATLKNDSGDVVDRCRYGASADSPKRC